MKYLFLVTLASTALGALCDTDPLKEPTYTGSAKVIDCLTAFNEARSAAGLASFASAGDEFRIKDLAESNKEFVNNVCKALMTHQPLDQKDTNFNRTIALAIQDGDDGDCAAAVTHFNGALSLLGTLPPAFSKGDDSVYKQLQAVSFVALYNPKENPKLDCGYFTCKKLETTTTTPSTSTITGGTRASGDTGSQTVTATLHGLLCATSPPALIVGQAPFDQEQFDKIKGAINSASAAAPAFLTLGIVAAVFMIS